MTLLAGANVLQSSTFNTYNDFSETSQLINFSDLTKSTSRYQATLDSGTFELNSSDGQITPDNTITSAATGTGLNTSFTLTAKDSGLFALYAISLDVVAPASDSVVTFTGTAADGSPVTAVLPVTASAGFQNFVFPSNFTAISSVTWTQGNSLLATNIVATELFPGNTPVKTAVPVATVNSTFDAVIFVADLASNGESGLLGTIPNFQIQQGSGVFNGTPWYDVVDSTNQQVTFFFQGDLYLPANSDVLFAGIYTVKIVVAGNVILGSGVTFTADAGVLVSDGGGGSGGSGVEARAVLVAEALEDRAARGVPGVVPVSLVESAGARATKRPREDRTERTAPRALPGQRAGQG